METLCILLIIFSILFSSTTGNSTVFPCDFSAVSCGSSTVGGGDSGTFSSRPMKKFRTESISNRTCLNQSSYARKKTHKITSLRILERIHGLERLTLMCDNEKVFVVHWPSVQGRLSLLGVENFLQLKVFSVRNTSALSQKVHAVLGKKVNQ